VPVTAPYDESKCLLALDEADWSWIGEYAARGDARLICAKPQPDAELYGERCLAYAVLSAAIGDIQHLVKIEGLAEALRALQVLQRSSAMQTWAAILGHSISDLCNMVALQLSRGKTLMFEAVDVDGAKPSSRPYPPKPQRPSQRKVAA
jgi:hypothetical protein